MAAKKAKKAKIQHVQRGPDTTSTTYRDAQGQLTQGFRLGGHFQQIANVPGKGVGGGSSQMVDMKPKKKKGK